MNTSSYELRFQSLFEPGRGFAFPCDAQGRVQEQALSATARSNLQRVLSSVGRDFYVPVVLPCTA